MSWSAAVALLIALSLGIGWKLRPRNDDAATLFAKTLAAIKTGDLSQVRRVRAMLLQDPSYASHSRLLDGWASLSDGNPEVALQRLLPIPRDSELRGEFQIAVARAFHATGQFVEAEQHLSALVRKEPKNVEARRWLGIVYYDLGSFDHAIEHTKVLAELTPDDYRAHRLLGLMYHDFEIETEAIQNYRLAIERSPPEPVLREIQEELARSLVSFRKYAEALKVIEAAPATGPLLVLASQCHWSMGAAVLARATLDRARLLDPHLRELSLLEAEILESEGHFDEAFRVVSEAVTRHPYDPEVRYQLSLLLREQGHAERAAEELQRWEELKTTSTRLTELNLQAIGKPHDRELREELARLCDVLGKTELAVMWRKAAAACPPRSASPVTATTP